MGQTLHILPGTGSCRQKQREILTTTPVVLGDPCLTVSMLVKTFYASLPRQNHRISSGGRVLLATRLLSRCNEHSCQEVLRLAPFPGFSGALTALFDELNGTLITPDMLERAASRLAGSYPQELAHLYRLHRTQLHSLGILDRYDPDRAVLEHLRSGGPLPEELSQVSVIRVSRIHEFIPLHRELLLELARRIPLAITFPYDPEEPEAFAGALPLIESLERMGDDSPLTAPPNFAPPEGPFTASLFRRGDTTPLPDGLTLLEAPSPTDEACRLGARIRRLLEAGYSPSDVAILCRDASRHAPMVREVCRRYRIPLTTTEGTSLAASPLVHACLAPLSAARDRISRQSLVDMASSTYLRPRHDSLAGSDIDALLREARYIDDNVCRAETALGRHIRLLRGRGRDTSREEACLRMLRPLLAAARRFSRMNRTGELLPLLNRHIEEFQLYHHAIGGGGQETVWRDAVAITSFQQILDDLAADITILGLEEAPTTPSLALSALRQATAGARLAERHRDAVSLLSFDEAAGLSFAHVFIMGLNEGNCPFRPPQEPLLSDALRAELNRHLTPGRLATSSDRARVEPLLFRFAVASARSTLTLSFSATDESGSELLPSEYLDGLLCNPALPVLRPVRLHAAPPPDDCHDRQEILAALLGSSTGPPSLASAITCIRTTAERDAERCSLCNEPPSKEQSQDPGLFKRYDILQELQEYHSSPPGNTFSPTQLEEYARCPFRFYLQRLLGIVPPRELELEPSTADRGSLLHALLRQFFELASRRGMLPLCGADSEHLLLKEAATLLFAQWEAENDVPAFLRETEKARTVALAAAVLAEEARDVSGLVPVAWEHRLTPLQLTAPTGECFQLTGIIDRVDSSADGRKLRVVDYKLSKNKGRYSQMLLREKMGVTSFQMPVYAAAAAAESRHLTGQPWAEITMRYWTVRAGSWTEQKLAAEQEGGDLLDCSTEGMMKGEDNFFWRVWALIKQMEAGQFNPTPEECSTCPFPAVCRTAE